MSAIRALERMLAAGVPLDTALDLAKQFEADVTEYVAALAREMSRDTKAEARKAKDAERKRVERASKPSEEIHGNPRTAADEPDAALTCAQVVNTTSSLRSEDKPPVSPIGETPPPKLTHAKPNGFARFWEAYPNKTGKGAAEKAFAKAVRGVAGPDPPGQLVAAVERAKQGRQWLEGFVPNPTTWLNQRRWEDEIEPPRAPRQAHERPHPDQRQAAREDSLRAHHAGAMAALNRRLGSVG